MFEFADVKFREILDIPSLHISRHKITTVIGPSGSGKTTILRMLNKMISPTMGYIRYEGERLDRIDSITHRRSVTMLSQSPAIFEGNIKENLVAGLNFQKKEVPDDAQLEAMLARVKLRKALGDTVQNLSGGEKQRLALGRILLLDSDVYLLDEPSSALDESTAEAVIDMIADYARSENKTLVMVTHSKAIAKRFSDDIIEVLCGKCARRQV